MAGATLLRGAAFADGRSATLRTGISLLIRDGRVAYIGPDDGAPAAKDQDAVDASGATIVPGLVDCHAHFTGLGGANWIARFEDDEAQLLARAPDAARALVRAGVLTARDVGAPRHLNVRIRDELRKRTDAPLIVAAGTWIARRGTYVPFAIQVDSAGELRAAAIAELDAGADWVKLAVDTGGMKNPSATFSVDELRPMVEAVHARGAKVAAHAQMAGADNAARAGIDSVEHGFGVDEATATLMAERTALVTTLSVPVSVRTFATTVGGKWAEQESARHQMQERAFAAVRAAKKAGVRIVTGSDFGGGSVRPGHLAWEVELLVAAGLEPYEALGAATWRGGELLGNTAGTIGPGLGADFMLVHGDPLADPGALWRVWRVYRGGVRVA